MKGATASFLFLCLPAFALAQETAVTPLQSQPMAGFARDSFWQSDTTRPDLYSIGMAKTEGMRDAEVLVVAQRGPAPRTRDRWPQPMRAGGPTGGVQRTVSADSFRGQRVRLSARIKTSDAVRVQMFLSAIKPGAQLGYDMPAIHGTTDWRRYEIVMDVPRDADELSFGFFVGGGDHLFLPRDGKGVAWADSFMLEAVGKDVAVSRNYLDAGWRQPTTSQFAETSFYYNSNGDDHHTMELQAEAARTPPPPTK